MRRTLLAAVAVATLAAPLHAQTWYTDRRAWLAALSGVPPTALEMTNPTPSGTFQVCMYGWQTPPTCDPSGFLQTGNRYEGFAFLGRRVTGAQFPLAPAFGRLYMASDMGSTLEAWVPDGISAMGWVFRPKFIVSIMHPALPVQVVPTGVGVTMANGAGTGSGFASPPLASATWPDVFLGVITPSPIVQVRMSAIAGLPPYVAAIDVVSFEYAATAVPEPSTYALMATGLLAIGAVARRRRV